MSRTCKYYIPTWLRVNICSSIKIFKYSTVINNINITILLLVRYQNTIDLACLVCNNS